MTDYHTEKQLLEFIGRSGDFLLVINKKNPAANPFATGHKDTFSVQRYLGELAGFTGLLRFSEAGAAAAGILTSTPNLPSSLAISG
jgi:hypothetical protein